MAHEEKQAAVAAELLPNNQNKFRIGRIIRTLLGIIFSLLSLVSILLLGLMILTYFLTQIDKDSVKISIWLFGILSVLTFIPGFLLLKPGLNILNEKMKPEIHDSGKYYAGFWRRLGAGLVDLLMFSPIYFGWYFLGKINLAVFEIAYWIGISATIYTLLMISRFGQTIGKMVFKVKVLKVSGAEVTFKEALKRIYGDICIWIIHIISHIYSLSKINIDQLNGMTFHQINQEIAKVGPWTDLGALLMFLWYFSEFITLLFNRKKRAIHDFIAGTILLVENKSASMH